MKKGLISHQFAHHIPPHFRFLRPDPTETRMSADHLYLPEEILTEILERLPAKSLLRFRSVSRSWNSLITSQPFIALHLRRSIRASSSSSAILLRHYSKPRRRELNTVYRDDDGEALALEQALDFPIKTNHTYFYAGACHGLLCLSDYLTNRLQVVLWNPSIRACSKLPVPGPIDADAGHTYVVGFGFDCVAGVYKVLRLVYVVAGDGRRLAPHGAEVFALGTDRWRRVDAEVPCVVSNASRQAFFHGAVHWIGYRPGSSLVIVAFDVHEEVFREIDIPSSIIHPSLDGLSLAVYGDSLCLLEYNPPVGGCGIQAGVFVVWVLKRYGDAKESWTKEFSVDMGDHAGFTRVAGFRKRGEILVVNGKEELVSYDPKSRRVQQLGLHGVGRSFEATPHMDSLVLLKGAARSSGRTSSCRPVGT